MNHKKSKLMAVLLMGLCLLALPPAHAQSCNGLLKSISRFAPQSVKEAWADFRGDDTYIKQRVARELEDESGHELVEDMLGLSSIVDPNLSPDEQILAVEDNRISWYRENYVRAGFHQRHQERLGKIKMSEVQRRYSFSADFTAREMGRWLWQTRNAIRTELEELSGDPKNQEQANQLISRIEKIDMTFTDYPPEEMFRDK